MTRPVTRQQMVALDRWAIQVLGIPGLVLMEHAGKAVAEAARRLLRPGGQALILCGRGNNGGDGFVAARHLFNWGLPVRVRVHGSLDQYPPGSDPAVNLAVLQRLELDVAPLSEEALDLQEKPRPGVLVDALFGTGLRGAPRPPADRLIEAVNRLQAEGVPVVAVDLPSGLDPDTGETPGAVVRATCTVTFARPKVGFFRGRGPEVVGQLIVADISIPPRGPGCPVGAD